MREIVAVIVGAALGTGLRFVIDAAIPHADDAFPVSTLVVNVAGSFVLAYLVARVWPTTNTWQKAGLGTGLLGSFTTFSAFAVSLLSLTAAGEWGPAIVYLVATLIGGIGAALAGLTIGGRTSTPIELGSE